MIEAAAVDIEMVTPDVISGLDSEQLLALLPMLPDHLQAAAAEAIEVTAQEQYLIVVITAVEAIGQGWDIRLFAVDGAQRPLRIREDRQGVGQDLEDVVTGASPQQIGCLSVESSRQHVVAGTAEDPILA